ncbi:hypothetical protein [Cellulophaga baltica]|uniref:hypothetical protein n=1 Tax=Cellulophaga baltica TaxID=76594 RepID=UPI002495715E|nr:hypothetical protein [Cellulophaga baltica]
MYIILFSLIMGLIMGYVVTKNYYQKKINDAEVIIKQQEKTAITLQEIDDYMEEL